LGHLWCQNCQSHRRFLPENKQTGFFEIRNSDYGLIEGASAALAENSGMLMEAMTGLPLLFD